MFNKIIRQLYKLYSVQQSTTALYSQEGNSMYERINMILHTLLKTLPKM